MTDDQTKDGGQQKDITLLDVVAHMQNMEQRLSSQIKGLSGEIKGVKSDVQGLTKRMDALEAGVKTLEKNMNERFDALQEDIFATANDTLMIRRHVGMPVPEEV